MNSEESHRRGERVGRSCRKQDRSSVGWHKARGNWWEREDKEGREPREERSNENKWG